MLSSDKPQLLHSRVRLVLGIAADACACAVVGVPAANGIEQRAAIAGAGEHWAKTFNRVFQASSYLQKL